MLLAKKQRVALKNSKKNQTRSDCTNIKNFFTGIVSQLVIEHKNVTKNNNK